MLSDCVVYASRGPSPLDFLPAGGDGAPVDALWEGRRRLAARLREPLVQSCSVSVLQIGSTAAEAVPDPLDHYAALRGILIQHPEDLARKIDKASYLAQSAGTEF